MPRYYLTREETFLVPYVVEADSEDEAKEKVRRGEVESDGLDWAECVRTGPLEVSLMRTPEETWSLIENN